MSVDDTTKTPLDVIKVCKVWDCRQSYSGKGYCKRHYDQMRTLGCVKEVKEGHGMYMSSEYKSWVSMKTRCYNVNHNHFNSYGGKGIQVYAKWRNDFMAFFGYMGKKPTKGHTLDRIDNEKGYEPGNVRWATKREQAINRRTASRIGYPGIYTYSSKHKGVRWRAGIYLNNKEIMIGRLDSLEEALSARLFLESL